MKWEQKQAGCSHTTSLADLEESLALTGEMSILIIVCARAVGIDFVVITAAM